MAFWLRVSPQGLRAVEGVPWFLGYCWETLADEMAAWAVLTRLCLQSCERCRSAFCLVV